MFRAWGTSSHGASDCRWARSWETGIPIAAAILRKAAQDGDSTSPGDTGSSLFRDSQIWLAERSYSAAARLSTEPKDSSGSGGLIHQRCLVTSTLMRPFSTRLEARPVSLRRVE